MTFPSTGSGATARSCRSTPAPGAPKRTARPTSVRWRSSPTSRWRPASARACRAKPGLPRSACTCSSPAHRAAGRLSASGEFQGFFERGAGKLGMSRVSVAGKAGQVCYGTGSFMALQPPRGVTLHPVPLRSRKSPEPSRLDEENLSAEEKKILRQADAALAAGGVLHPEFLDRRGKSCPEERPACRQPRGARPGRHHGRAGGGVRRCCAVGQLETLGNFRMVHQPGEGATLRATSRVVHQGRLTAVVRTQITGKKRRRVLEVVTTHSA